VHRRLLLVLVGTVAVALAVAGLGTYTLLRRDDRSREVERLKETSNRLAQNADALNSLGTALDALNLTAVARVRFPRKSPTLDQVTFVRERGLPMQSLVEVTEDWTAEDFALVARGQTVARVNKGLTWAIAPVGPATASSSSSSESDSPVALDEPDQFEAIVLAGAFRDTAQRAVGWLFLGSLAALLLAVAAAFAVAQNLSAPLRAATAAYRRIANGDLDIRVSEVRATPSRHPDEVDELLGALDSMAESLKRARDQERQFLLSVSHDLRTPLTSIRGYAEALADGAVTDPARSAAVIISEARRLERLVKDLLDLAKLESHQFTLNPSLTDLTDLVTDIADGFLPAASEAGVALQLEANETIRALIDSDRVAQVVANLIENALKFANHTVTVGVRKSNDDITVFVTDDGPGIDQRDLPHVFERSFTSDRQPTRKIGSGLGLAIVHELVGAMNGNVTITTGNNGTTFAVLLH
jgi:signal transduction histidine kinase